MESTFEEGVRRHQNGRLSEAEAIYRQVLAANPQHGGAWHLLGVIAQQVGQFDVAIELISRAVVLEPHNAAMHSNLGEALRASGRHDEAITAYERAAALNPELPQAHNNLGLSLAAKGRAGEAETCFRRALALHPDYPEAHNNLGNSLTVAGRAEEGITHYQRAVALRPDYAEAYNNLGYACLTAGRFAEAIAHAREALALRPDYPEACTNLGNALVAAGRIEEAVGSYERAAALTPRDPIAQGNLGVAFTALNRLDEAIVCYQRALECKPHDAVACSNLGSAYALKGQLKEAVQSLDRAIALQPGYADAINVLGNVQMKQGQLDEALALFSRAMELNPGDAAYHSNLIYGLHLHSRQDAARIERELKRWDERHGRPSLILHTAGHGRDLERPLKIGYVSPDLRRHPVGQFVRPLLAHHDPGQALAYCYSGDPRPDAGSEELKQRAHAWREVVGIPDEELAKRIEADGIDILVDLSMHTANNRLPLFARRAAPIQVAWLGYPGSTGLSAMDYRLTDANIEPPGGDAFYSSEERVRLPDAWCCYQPWGDESEVAPLPALQNATVTFGCLNNFAKVNVDCVRLWSHVLAAVPGARFLLRAPEGHARDWVRRAFGDHGVATGRLEFVAQWPTQREYLQAYARIDIALDPFPYNGTATTCEALWMGVPVLALIGRTPPARASYSLLCAAGLGKFVAADQEDYVRLAAALAADREALADLRRGLRPQMRSSALMDAPRFARAVENAYRQMQRRWVQSDGRRAITIPVAPTVRAGVAHHREGRLAEAESIYRQVLAAEPLNFDALHMLGVIANQMGQYVESVKLINQALRLEPRSSAAHANISAAYSALGRLDEAIAACQLAVECNPRSAEAHSNLGNLLLLANQAPAAIDACQQAILLNPDYAAAWNNLGGALSQAGRLDEAATACRRSLELTPHFGNAHNNLGQILQAQGRATEALGHFRAAAAAAPHDPRIQNNVIYSLHLQETLDEAAIIAELAEWNRRYGTPASGLVPRSARRGDPAAPLKVGYVSSDLRDHPVGRFLLPLLTGHDREKVQAHCYASVLRPDAVTARLKEQSVVWRDVAGLTDERLARRIAEDEIDVLVDVAMHTANTRLTVFAYRPAPVQVSWLAYPGSTGLKTIDYRITDGQLEPEGHDASWSSERPVRLPGVWCCFQPLGDEPEVAPCPVLGSGRITFGSLNNFAKINEGCLRLWARVLGEVPSARLLLRCPPGETRGRVMGILRAGGVQDERVVFAANYVSREDYLRAYADIDIALDSFPYNGMTTTCDALWMGVPTPARIGEHPASRSTYSLLCSIGLPELTATGDAEYLRLLCRLAGDLDRLAELRATIRQRMCRSALMDAKEFARQMETAFLKIFSLCGNFA